MCTNSFLTDQTPYFFYLNKYFLFSPSSVVGSASVPYAIWFARAVVGKLELHVILVMYAFPLPSTAIPYP